ncbi:PAS domain-containing protein [Halopseudomonas sp.]|uniref:PAS domain-containing protein n=1 Tax=Halopseudomonas sp. TaxID=2901191 RepID=UPI00311FD3C0
MAKLKTLRNGRIALPFGILLLALCFLFLAHSAWQQREAHWRDQLFLDARAQLNGMRHAQQAMRGEAQIAVYSLREDPDIQRLIRRICVLIDQHGRGHPEVQRLRAQLISDLDGFWHLLQQAGAKELQIHLAADQTALLRMQNPESWGDRHDAARPLLRSVATSGIQQSGLTLHLHGASESAVAPILADDHPDSPPVATLQIGFPAFTASPASQSEGLALLIDSATLAPGTLRSPLPALGRGRWLLADELGGPLPDWLSEALSTLDSEHPEQLYSTSNGTWLLSLIQVDAVTRGQTNGNKPAAMLLWRDISARAAAHQQEQQQLAAKWLLALLAACSLFTALLLFSYRAARRQMLHHANAIRAESRKRERQRRLLEIIARTQSAYIQQNQMSNSLDEVLEPILQLTSYRVGVLSQAIVDTNGQLQLQILDTLDRRPDAQPTATALLTAMHSASNDQQARLIDSDDPDLNNAVLLPLLYGGRLMGMLALSHGQHRAAPELLDFLAPLQTSLGQLLHAIQQREAHEALQLRLERQRLALRSLNRIAADFGLSHQQQLERLLDLGCDYLNLDLGLVSQISDSVYEVQAASSGDDNPAPGTRFDFEQTYCNLTFQHHDVLAIDSMGRSRFNGHPCYQSFALECYIGIPLFVDGRRYGTLNFSSATPRQRPFDEVDLDFMRLCARWCSGLLEHAAEQQAREALLQRFAKLHQHVPGMVYQYQLSRDGRSWFPFASDGIRNIYDLTPELAALSADPAVALIHPDDHDRILAEIGESAEQLSEWRSEYRINHPRLGEIWVAGYASPERLDNGDIVWHGFITDITSRKRIEQNLANEQQRLARIIDATGVGSWEWDLTSHQLQVSSQWLQMLGYPPDHPQPLEAKTWVDLIHPEDQPNARAQMVAHLRGETDHLRYLCRAKHRDGHWVWIQSHGQVTHRDPSGHALWMSGIHADISQEMAASEETREARAFLDAVINASTEVAIIAVDTNGAITLFNSGAEKLLGYRANEVIGLISPERFHLASEVQERSIELTRRNGKPIEGLEVFLHEVRGGGSEVRPWTYVRKDGQQRLVNLTVTRIDDASGEPVGFLGIATDMTDLINTTRALQQSESRFRSMVGNLPGAVYRCAPAQGWSMSYLSDEIERITGYPAGDFIDNQYRSYASIVHPDDLQQLQTRTNVLRQQPNFEYTYRLIHADGHIVQVREKGRGEFDSQGQLQGVDGFIWDVTEQVRVEQMKAQFVSTVSHELRTPLSAISGAIKLIDGGALGPVPDSMHRLLGIAVQNSDNLHRLINDLLDMDKLTAGKLQIDLLPHRLQPLLEKALELNHSYAEQFQVQQVLGQVDDVEVLVDDQRLGQMLANLLSNAAKFSHPQGQIRLDALRQGDKVEISVHDDGIGIPAAEQERIFDKFFQVDSTSTRKRPGSGLGLAITRELARHMGGDTGFESSAGAGSRFWISLPCNRPDTPPESV